MKINPNPTKKRNRVNKKLETEKKAPKWLDEYRCMNTYEKKVLTESMLEKFATYMLEVSKSNDVLCGDQLFHELGIPESTFYLWLEKYPNFREVYRFCMTRIGIRRETLGLGRKVDSNIVLKSQHFYSKKWKDEMEWLIGLNKKEENSNALGSINVIMPSFSAENNSISERTPEEVAKKITKTTRDDNRPKTRTDV